MALIEFPRFEHTPPPPDRNSGSAGSSSVSRHLKGSPRDILSAIVPVNTTEGSIHFMSNGSFSMHDLVEHLLSLTGTADLFITTWAMTENPARVIKHLMDQGMVRKIFCLFDFKIRKNSPKAYQLASSVMAKVHLAHCHAKTTVILNEKFGVTIIGSANYTRNPRIESGVICFDRHIAEFHAEWIQNEMSKSEACE